MISYLLKLEERATDFFSKKADNVNPILVKEVRRMLISKGFAYGFILLLLVVWLATTFASVSLMSNQETRESGREFFSWYFRAMMTPVSLFIPLMVYHSIQEEFTENTFDMVFITPLKPQMIVRGKLYAGLVQSLMYFSAMSPFLCFCYMLQGISSLTILFYIFVGCCIVIILCLWAILMASIAGRNSFLNVIGLFMTLFGSVFIWGIVFVFSEESSILEISFNNIIYVITTSIICFYLLIVFVAISAVISIERLRPFNPYSSDYYSIEDFQEIKREKRKKLKGKSNQKTQAKLSGNNELEIKTSDTST